MINYKSEFSEIEFSKEKIKTKNKEGFFEKSDFQYLDLDYANIKEVEIKTLHGSKIPLIICTIIGLGILFSNLQKPDLNPYNVYLRGGRIWMVNRTMEELVPFIFSLIIMVVLGIFLSILSKKKYDGIKTINIKYVQNNNEQKVVVFSSRDNIKIDEVFSNLKQRISS